MEATGNLAIVEDLFEVQGSADGDRRDPKCSTGIRVLVPNPHPALKSLAPVRQPALNFILPTAEPHYDIVYFSHTNGNRVGSLSNVAL
jgi:hypothetical protein